MKPLIGITSDMDGDRYSLGQEYISALTCAGAIPLILAPVLADVVKVSEFLDGLLLSGGDDLLPEYLGEDVAVPLERLKFVQKERTEFELALVQEVMKREKPVLGICYGMQLLNIALGGSLTQDIEFQVEGAVNHREEHRVRITQSFDEDSSLDKYGEVKIRSSHHQAVRRLAHSLEVFAVSEDGIVEGFFRRDYPFLVGVQWHPEKSLFSRGEGTPLSVNYPEKKTGDESEISSMVIARFVRKALVVGAKEKES
jgi:putative glutamine amidotransferase